MGKIKHTKNELKNQRDALRRFDRYLPTLQLKKQQLQIEVRHLENQIEEKQGEEKAVRANLSDWIKLFSEPVNIESYLKVKDIHMKTGNIAGVNIPVLDRIDYDRRMPDLFCTPPWLDDGLDALEKLSRLRAELRILEEQHRLLVSELRTTTQRVNLFEKVKIPEAKENIRVIRIFLGDQQTAEVARAKIAKSKSLRAEAAA